MDELSISVPRPEHPRPDFHRGLRDGIDWLNLNGDWQFEFDPNDRGADEGWQNAAEDRFSRTIRVPFPWESHLAWGTEALAGNEDWFSAEAWLHPEAITQDNYREAPRHSIGWYRREFTVPQLWDGRRVYLNIGAADWDLRVWVNGETVGGGESGYLPLSFDITGALHPGENRLVIRVQDPEDHSAQPIGKQTRRWYTCTSGIWQTVWLEPRAASHIAEVLVQPSLASAQAAFAVQVRSGDENGPLAVAVEVRASTGAKAGSATAAVVEDGRAQVSMQIERPIAWTPDSPHMYRATVQLLRDGEVIDTIQTQFGMRDIDTGPLHEGGPTYIRLNGEPIYLRGALDQSFHPAGVYTHPTDAEIKRDFVLAKQAGLNFLRLHIKTPDPRYCYWADRCGVLLMCDMPGFDNEGYSEIARERWERNAWGQIKRDFNHPSIFSWCLFNETWGLGSREYATAEDRQAWVRNCYEMAKQLDPTRLVEDNSPCLYDHVITDINSWHFYINDYDQAREHVEHIVAQTAEGSQFNFVGGNRQGNQPLLNSEYGGIGARMGDLDVSWCLRFLTNELRRHEKICGYVYTELTDIEWEHNGLYDYDRSPKQFGYDPALLLGEFFVGFDLPPAQTVAPGSQVSIPVFLRPSELEAELAQRVTWRATFTDRFGYERLIARDGGLNADGEGACAISLALPREAGLGRIAALLEDDRGHPAALNFSFFEVVGDSEGVCGEKSHNVLTVDAGDGVAAFPEGVERGEVAGETHLLAGTGDGQVEYQFAFPDDLDPEQIGPVTLLAELSSARPGAPQTGSIPWPATVVISVGDEPITTLELHDQPADSRGALSHMHGFLGRYGRLVRLQVPAAMVKTAVETGILCLRIASVDSGRDRGGLTIYGSRAGRYPCGVTLLIGMDGSR